MTKDFVSIGTRRFEKSSIQNVHAVGTLKPRPPTLVHYEVVVVSGAERVPLVTQLDTPEQALFLARTIKARLGLVDSPAPPRGPARIDSSAPPASLQCPHCLQSVPANQAQLDAAYGECAACELLFDTSPPHDGSERVTRAIVTLPASITLTRTAVEGAATPYRESGRPLAPELRIVQRETLRGWWFTPPFLIGSFVVVFACLLMAAPFWLTLIATAGAIVPLVGLVWSRATVHVRNGSIKRDFVRTTSTRDVRSVRCVRVKKVDPNEADRWNVVAVLANGRTLPLVVQVAPE